MLHSYFTFDHQIIQGAGVDLGILSATECRAEGHDLLAKSSVAGKAREQECWINEYTNISPRDDLVCHLHIACQTSNAG